MFVVEKEHYDRQAETTHVIGVYATKQEAFGLITVVAECKNVSSPIGIEHIRNFLTKINRLKISKGIDCEPQTF